MSHAKKEKKFPSKIINAQKLKDKIDSIPDLLIINVLDHQTYVDCHIPGSINIQFEELLQTVASLEKEKEIVVYCAHQHCNLSNKAYALLQDLGFTHVYEYADGMRDWFKKGFDTTGACTFKYLHE